MAKARTKRTDAEPATAGGGPRDPRTENDQFWWMTELGDKSLVHTKVVTYGKALRDLYATAHKYDRIHERIYEGRELRRYPGAMAALSQAGFNAARLNASKSVVNTLVSRLSKDRPLPSVIVNNGDWYLKRQARDFKRFIVGEMTETDFDERSREALQDGAIIGSGITQIDDTGDGEKIFAERVLRNELLFDPRECLYGKPFQSIRVRRIARAHLAERFPDFKRQIFDAESARVWAGDELDDETRTTDLEDYVDVYAAHARSKQHALCIENATLIHEAWESPRLPYAIFRFQKPRRGFWSKGLIYDLKDIQHRVNCIVRDMQMNLQATGRGYYAVQGDNDIPSETLTGWQPFKLKYKGQVPPVFTAPTPINPAQLQMLQFFLQQMYDLTGVSQSAATSKSALGAGASGIALDTQYDIDSERYAMEQAQYAVYRLEAGQLYFDAAGRVHKKRDGKGKKPKYVSGWRCHDAIEELDYDEVSLDQDQYRLQLEPVSYIPQTRAGKLSAVGQLTQAGVIPQWLSAALFDEPDLEWATKITMAAFRACERKMDDLGNPKLPMPACAPYNDFALEMKMTIAYLNNAEAEKAPPEVMERYLAYLSDVKSKMKLETAGTPAPAMAPAVGFDPTAAAAMQGQPGVVPGVGQSVPPMSGGAMPPEMAPPIAA